MDLIKGLLLLTLAISCNGFEMARLYSTRGTITSSTLAWLPVKRLEQLPEHAVTIGVGGPMKAYWCRAREHAVWIAGVVADGKCKMNFLGNVVLAEEFHVLVSLNGSARVVYVPWDSLVALPKKPVSTPDMLLALVKEEGGPRLLAGYVDPREMRAHYVYKEYDRILKKESGVIMTEVEPIKYRLSGVRLHEKTKRRFHEEFLQELELFNNDNHASEIWKEVPFVFQHNMYFSKVKGTIIALPTQVSGPDIFPANISWGFENKFHENRSHVISYDLPARSKVKIQLVAKIRSLEGAYSGVLTSMYEDGEELQRTVEGIHTERKLSELQAKFDQVLSLDNGQAVDEFPPETVVLLHSSTTTPSPLIDGKDVFSGANTEDNALPQPQGVGVNRASTLASSLCGLLIFLAILLQ